MGDARIKAMSPHEYLEHLQREEHGGSLPPYAADVGDVLTASLIASLPQQHRAQLDRIAIGVLPTKSVNAWVIPVPSGGEVVGFGFGTMSFMIALNKVLLSRINMLGFEPTLELEVAARRAFSIVNSFFGTEELPRWPVTPRRMLIAAALSNVQTAFVVGHELGHVLLGHMKEPYYNEFRREKLHEMEVRADERGGELALESFKRVHDPVFGSADTTLAQAGVDIFMTYMLFVRRVTGQPAGAHTEHHPAWETRRDRFRERFQQEMTKDALALSVMAENVFAGFIDVLESEGELAPVSPRAAKSVATTSPAARKAAGASRTDRPKSAKVNKPVSRAAGGAKRRK